MDKQDSPVTLFGKDRRTVWVSIVFAFNLSLNCLLSAHTWCICMSANWYNSISVISVIISTKHLLLTSNSSSGLWSPNCLVTVPSEVTYYIDSKAVLELASFKIGVKPAHHTRDCSHQSSILRDSQSLNRCQLWAVCKQGIIHLVDMTNFWLRL